MKTKSWLMFSILVLAATMGAAWAQGEFPHGNRPPMGPPGGGPRPPFPDLESMDANQDGVVTQEEHAAAWNTLITNQFKRIDEDGNGTLDAEELAKRPGPPDRPRGEMNRPPEGGEGRGMGPRGGERPEPPDRPDRPRREMRPRPPACEEMDANQDGAVTLEEHQAAWAKFNAEQFKWLDKDGDGVLSDDECKFMGPQPGGPRGMGGPRGPRGPEEFRGQR